jgi:signal transduction histidine kinase
MADAERVAEVDTPRPRWYVLLAVWSIPALLNMMTWLTFSRLGGRPLTIWQALVGETPAWLLWAGLTPVIFALGRRFPVERGLYPGYLAVHGAAIVGASMAHAAATTVGILLAGVAASMGRPVPLIFANMLAQNIPFTAVMYAGLLGVRHGLVGAARVRREERVSSLLRSQLAEAQLGALRAQLRPHFLFNSLNAVSALVRDQETDAALEALDLMGDLLRRTLATESERETPLRVEIEYARTYLKLMTLRFSDRLRVSWQVPPELLECLVPPLLLQPLIENAIRHGVARRISAGRIVIAAGSGDHILTISVTDDGEGPPADWNRANGGRGLSNTRSRLEQLYGPPAGLTLSRADEAGGAVATVTLPLHR